MATEEQLNQKIAEETAATKKGVQDLIAEMQKTPEKWELSLKQQQQLIKTQKDLVKANNSLGGDLKKNYQDLKDGITTTVDGFINQTFGPFGGLVSSISTGFFKRAKEEKENLLVRQNQVGMAKDLVDEFQGQKGELTDQGSDIIETSQSSKETADNTKETSTTLTSIEKSSSVTAEGMSILTGGAVETVEKLGEIIDAGDRQADAMESIDDKTLSLEDQRELARRKKEKGGAVDKKSKKMGEVDLGPGLTGLSLVLGTIGGLTAPGLFQLQHMPKILDNFKTKFTPKFNKLFGTDFPELRKSTETWGNKTKNVVRNAKGQFVKVTDAVTDAGKASKGLMSAIPTSFDDLATKIKGLKEGMKLTAGADEVAGIGSKFGGVAKFLVKNVVGKALSVAGNPVFSYIAMGKDVFDVANAVTDDDVKTSVKNEDIGALVGGFIGGAIGIVGGPAGVALGMGLGNMAGEFIGQAMDDPEIMGAIDKVKTNLQAENKGLADEIAAIEASIKAETDPHKKALLEAQRTELNARKTKVETELKEFTDENSALNKEIKALETIEAQANKINAEKALLEKQMEEAEARGDTAMVARLQNRVNILDEEFDKADKAYQEQSKKLRETASATSGALAEQTNSFFDKMVTEGGFFGSILGGLSKATSFVFGTDELGMKGEAKTKYLSEQMRKIDGKIAEQEALIEAGDDFDWALEPRAVIITKLQREKKRLESVNTAARGGIVVTRPTYLPSSGTVVGEHGTWGGRGAAGGGIPDGGSEAVIPLTSARGQQMIQPFATNIAGQVMNNLAADRIGLGGPAGMNTPPAIVDSSSQQVINNTTIVNSPKPTGPQLPGAGRDHAVSHFRHVA
jgi:hypothetical protein